ncbi:hypothetical protein IQ250_17645 [Pseudanabaenaceae cyanobacterium LEGE 13415]|nr:hypothetical protein [Pseudanabaenaceae cyanobacterium LEGE 13415]
MRYFHSVLIALAGLMIATLPSIAELILPANNYSEIKLVSDEGLGVYPSDQSKRTGVRLIEWKEALRDAERWQDLYFSEKLPAKAISPDRLVYEVTLTRYKRENGVLVHTLHFFDAETGQGIAASGRRY